MSKLIVIVGVTGLQGSSVAHTFLNLPEWKVRGISRNQSSPAALALISKGVQIIQADLNDEKSLYPAFEGANVVFSNTDFFGLFFGALMSKNDSPQQYAFEREVEQGINIARAAASPAVYHNNSKTEIIQTISIQFPELANRMSMVQVGHYATKQKQPDGSFVVKRTFSPGFKMPFVVPHKDTGEFVKALVLDLPAGTHILGASEILTWPEWTRIWAETLGVKAVFEQVSLDVYFQDAPEEMKKELSETFAYTDEFGYTRGDPAALSAEQLGIKLPLTSMEEYIRDEDWSLVL